MALDIGLTSLAASEAANCGSGNSMIHSESLLKSMSEKVLKAAILDGQMLGTGVELRGDRNHEFSHELGLSLGFSSV